MQVAVSSMQTFSYQSESVTLFSGFAGIKTAETSRSRTTHSHRKQRTASYDSENTVEQGVT
jgi:hypothetical protein